MDIRALANSYTTRINDNLTINWVQATGYATDAAGHRVPTTSTTAVQAQVQGVSGEDLKHIDGLNMQGVFRSVLMFGNVQGIERSKQRGGDVLQFPEIPGGANSDWRVVSVMETWATWARVLVVMQ